MSRLLFIVAVVTVVYLLLKSFWGRQVKEAGETKVEDTVRCAFCGVHIPKSESTMSEGKFYCCEAHRREYQASHSNRDAG